MSKEKRIKNKKITARVDDILYHVFTEYAREKGTTKTKIIDDFLRELLKDKLNK
jgi:hypothetical protein